MKTSIRGVEPRWLAVFIFFLVGMFLGCFVGYLYSQASLPTAFKQRLSIGDYQYINPTLAAQAAENYGNFNAINKDLEFAVRRIMTNAKQQHTVTAAGVYFRDLTAGGWLDENAGMQFSAGTVLKIPLMISYFKLADQDQQVLQDKIHFTDQYRPQKNIFISTSTPLQPNQDYTVTNLIEKMIDESDETAATLLYDHIDKNTLSEIYNDLGIDYTQSSAGQYAVSLRRYASFFRTLYAASYLSPNSSEQALTLLAQNKADSLLEAEVPRGVSIAYRTGGQTLMRSGSKIIEAYECGIVYASQHNYLLCAIADGTSLENIRAFFGSIGSTVYAGVSGA